MATITDFFIKINDKTQKDIKDLECAYKKAEKDLADYRNKIKKGELK